MRNASELAPILALVAALSKAAACVPKAHGYDDVRATAGERLGGDVRWRAHESSDNFDAATERLLERPLTAEAAVQVALYQNPALQGAFESLGRSRGELIHSLRLPNPEAGAALRYGAGERPEIDLDATLSLSQLLFIPWRKSAANAGFDAAKLEVARQALDIGFAARVAFFAYQAAAQTLKLERSTLGSLGAAMELAERLHEAGNLTDLELARERASYEEGRIAFTRAEANLAAAREELNAKMGVWGPMGARWTASAELPHPGPIEPLLKDVEQRALEQSLDLGLHRWRMEQAARNVDLSRLEGWAPDLRAGVSAERHDANWSLGPLAELELPLFYQGQGETVAALSDLRREQQLLLAKAVDLRARVRALAVRLRATGESVHYYRLTLLPLRVRVLEETQRQYNAMNTGVFQLLQAKRDQIAAEKLHIELLHEYWTLRTELERAVAGGLPGGGGSPRVEPSANPDRRHRWSGH